MCELFGVPRAALPDVRPSAGDFGVVDAAVVGGPAGGTIPIAGVAGDQQAALFGHGCCDRGRGRRTPTAPARFSCCTPGTRRPAVERATGIADDDGVRSAGRRGVCTRGGDLHRGGGVQWLRDGLGIIAQASETEAMARSVASTDGVVFVPALTGLGAPHWEPHARGTIVGLTRGTTRAHLARAALEAMAYATDEVLATMNRQSGEGHRCIHERLRVDGGASQNDWLMQFQADVLGVPVERPDGGSDRAGRGGARGPGDRCLARCRGIRRAPAGHAFVPGSGRAAAQSGVREWTRAVDAVLLWARADGRANRHEGAAS